MAKNYQVPSGTQDFLPQETAVWQQVEQLIREKCANYGFQEIRTPVFEYLEVFKTENDSSDMVTKEMYSFETRGEKGSTSFVLRPEGTKGIVRSFVQHKLYGNTAELPQKFFYIGPMFRHERPQKGRYRQFHQFGIEAIGAKDPLLDAETIALGYSIIESLGIKNVQVLVNSLGDEESRGSYRQALKDYFKPHLSELCEDCRRRYEVNPLRILDCKVDRTNPLFKSAPAVKDYLNEASREYFEKVIQALDVLKIPYVIDDKLVRGLDYYSNTVYEAVPAEAAGQQAAVFAGGQYDGLVEYFGGGRLPGVGFGMGLERIIELAREQDRFKPCSKSCDVFVITMGDVSLYALEATQALREAGLTAERDYQGRSLKAQFKATERLQSPVIVIIGEEEMESRTVKVKNVSTQLQETVGIERLVEYVKESLVGEKE